MGFPIDPRRLRLSDEFIRRLVMSQPIPDRLIRDIAALPDETPAHVRKYAGQKITMTPALWETLKLVAAGASTPAIAEEFGIPVERAKDRVKRLLAYFDARDRMEIVVRCYREGIM